MNFKKLITTKRLKIYLLALTHLVHDVYTSFLAPILPILIEKFGLTYALAGLLHVMLRIPSLLNPLIGLAADKFGLKYFIVLAPAITAVAMSLIGNAPNYLCVLILLFITGLSSSFFHVPSPVILKRISDTRLGASMSVFQIGGELSRVVGPVIIIGAISLWGITGVYRLIPFGIIMSFILLLKFKDDEIVRVPTKRLYLRKPMVDTIKQGRTIFTFIFGLLLIKSFTASVAAAFLPTYLMTKGHSLWMAGGALSILQSAAIIGVLATGIISDKIGRKRLLIMVSIGAPFSMLLFISCIKLTIIPTVVLLGLIAFSSTPVVLALIQEEGFEYPSIANGIYMMMSFILSAFVVLLFGKVSDIIGLEKSFYISAVCSFVGLPFLFSLPVRKPPPGIAGNALY